MNKELIEMAINEDSRPFWEHLRAGELRVPRCHGCERYFYPNAYLCPHCGATGSSWEPVRGHGTVFTYTVLHRAYHPAFAERVPYNVAVIALEEGVHLLGNVDCPPEMLHIGLPVEVVLQEVEDGWRLPRFVPREVPA